MKTRVTGLDSRRAKTLDFSNNKSLDFIKKKNRKGCRMDRYREVGGGGEGRLCPLFYYEINFLQLDQSCRLR